MSAVQPLFACTRCNSRHPFEELSSGQQLCKECRGSYSMVKCTYCRTEFQQESKSSLTTICKKCEQNVKQFGKPAACEYCNIIAAFIGNKCQRCTNSEKKYGPPLTCEQCKQRCAFDRKDPESMKKVDGKLLCWLCTLSYKRALAKAKQNDTSIRHTSISIHKSSSSRNSSLSRQNDRHHHHHHHHSKSSLTGSSNNLSGLGSSSSSSLSKKPRLDVKATNGSSLSLPLTGNSDSALLDPSSSDHVIAVTQLKEQITNLQKQLQRKDSELLDKDKKIAELRSQLSREERDWREKLNQTVKSNSEKMAQMGHKLTALQKQNATLSKANKKNNTNNLNNITPNDSPLL